jgi:transmembrane sensor
MKTVRPLPPSDAHLSEASAWYVRLLDDERSTDDQAAFEAWLAADEKNPAAFEDAMQVWRAMDETSLSPDLINLRRDALHSFRRANRLKWAHGLSHRRWLADAIAACTLFGLVATSLWWALAPKIYETGLGERRVVALTDGSKVLLDAQTKLEVRYHGDRRDLKLDYGRAKFDVAKDPLRPFAVSAADKVVVATGTEFSVELLRRDVHVVLYEGHVAVLTTVAKTNHPSPVRLRRENAAADQFLTPGRELVTAIAATDAAVSPTNLTHTLSWEAGRLVFVDEPLASAVEQVNRYSDDKLGVGDPRAGQVLINGVYNAGDTPAFVEGVVGVSPVILQEQNGQKVFVSRR